MMHINMDGMCKEVYIKSTIKTFGKSFRNVPVINGNYESWKEIFDYMNKITVKDTVLNDIINEEVNHYNDFLNEETKNEVINRWGSLRNFCIKNIIVAEPDKYTDFLVIN